MGTILIPDGLRERIAHEARTALPRECCGLLVGTRQGEMLRVLYHRSTRNLATEPDRFEIDPSAHVALARALRGTGRAIVGCYHSHPNGAAEPSAQDLAGSSEEGFVWLIAAASGSKMLFRAFQREASGFQELALLDRLPERTV